MLSVNRLEKVIELEEQLRQEYQDQLDAKKAEIEKHVEQCAELQATIDAQETTIKGQLKTITELSAKASVNQKAEQLNRELTNRSENQQAEITELKKRVKALQKDLAEVRAENKELTRYDPVRMKKNLVANKKTLAEKSKANELLQKSLIKARAENGELEGRVKELEARAAELEPAEEGEEVAA